LDKEPPSASLDRSADLSRRKQDLIEEITDLEANKSDWEKRRAKIKEMSPEELKQYRTEIDYEIALANSMIDGTQKPAAPPPTVPEDLARLNRNRDKIRADLEQLEKGNPNKYKLLKAKVELLIAENERTAWIAKTTLERLKRPPRNLTPEQIVEEREW